MKGPKRREKLCLQIQQSSVVCCPDPVNAQRLLLTAACLICCCTMSLCTSPNPCAECRRRVNYICISWCRLDNPFIHTPQSSASRCVYHDESPTLSSQNACLGGFCFVSDTVAILERQNRKVTKQDATKPVEASLWCLNLIKLLQKLGVQKIFNLICFQRHAEMKSISIQVFKHCTNLRYLYLYFTLLYFTEGTALHLFESSLHYRLRLQIQNS